MGPLESLYRRLPRPYDGPALEGERIAAVPAAAFAEEEARCSSIRYKASDFPREILALFDRYVHGQIDRRGFLDGAGKFAVGGLTAAAILDILSPKYAEAQQVPKDDARLRAEYATYQSPKGYGRSGLSRPTGEGARCQRLLVVHENRGLNPHIEDVARRAGAGGLRCSSRRTHSARGGYPGDEDSACALFQQTRDHESIEDFVAAAQFLGPSGVRDRLGVVGFCFGGGIANRLAIADRRTLAPRVPFYGGAPALEDVGAIKAELLIAFRDDRRACQCLWPPYEAALKATTCATRAHVYPDTQHGFHNDTTPRYDAAAAALAWRRTMEFFKKNLV